jgi:thymidylate synthase
MKVLTARNVHVALPHALKLLRDEGIERQSRNGPVLQAPFPVTTVYERPWERVLFWKDRDANPFFHLYESLWMLAGRNDLAPLLKYAKNMASYSDDGKTLHGAYGHRWRQYFDTDQLPEIIHLLRSNPNDRRCVLQMWDAQDDLGTDWKDVPCNTIATFQRDFDGKLDLTVFCRSNDIVWGCYGANAVHFSMLLEYVAAGIGCPMGVYRQVSINWHGYLDTLKTVEHIKPDRGNWVDNPYGRSVGDCVKVVPMGENLDAEISNILHWADMDALRSRGAPGNEWARMVWFILRAHEIYRLMPKPDAFGAALDTLNQADRKIDWIVAAREWILRRELRWEKNDGSRSMRG